MKRKVAQEVNALETMYFVSPRGRQPAKIALRSPRIRSVITWQTPADVGSVSISIRAHPQMPRQVEACCITQPGPIVVDFRWLGGAQATRTQQQPLHNIDDDFEHTSHFRDAAHRRFQPSSATL